MTKPLFLKSAKFKVVFVLVALALAISGAAFLVRRRVPRVPMERFVPANALAFVEIDDVGSVLDGLTATEAWRRLAPPLGISSQLRDLGWTTDLLGRSGIGPEEAVMAGRAQMALVVTGLQAQTGANQEEGPFVHLKPLFCLVIDPHSGSEAAHRVVASRASLLANRIFGSGSSESDSQYQGVTLKSFQGASPEHELVAASVSELILVGNDREAVRSCIDTALGLSASCSGNPVIASGQTAVSRDGAAVFGFIGPSGVQKLLQLAPALVATRFTTDPDKLTAAAGVAGHVSEQAIRGLLYSSSFESGQVVDRYFVALDPSIAQSLADILKPGANSSQDYLKLIPKSVQDVTVLDISDLGEFPEVALKQISPRLDLVGGLALRELVASVVGRGSVPAEALSSGAGDRVVFVRLAPQKAPPDAAGNTGGIGAGDIVALVSVKNKTSMGSYAAQYLGAGQTHPDSQSYRGIDVWTAPLAPSTRSEGDSDRVRSAAFIGDYLVLGDAAEIRAIADAAVGGTPGDKSLASIASDSRTEGAVKDVAGTAPIITCRPNDEDAAQFMLGVSRVTRTTDGSPEILDQPSVRQALERVPASVSITRFRGQGIYIESRSALGNFGLLGYIGVQQ